MAANVQIVLTNDVAKLGKAGEIVKVRAGFARNFLIPRGAGVLATTGNIERVEHERQVAVARSAKLRAEASALAHQLEGLTLEIARPAGEGDKLFGSVTAKDVAAELAKKGFKVERKQIGLEGPLKTLGNHDLVVRLAPELTATIKVRVVKGGA